MYGARINLEHYRPYSPKNDYSGLGDVLELKAETTDGVTRLYARIDPTEKMLGYIKDREKVFTSMELMKPFGDTGKAYLVGLAMTTRPPRWVQQCSNSDKLHQTTPISPPHTHKWKVKICPKPKTNRKQRKKAFLPSFTTQCSAKKQTPNSQAKNRKKIDYSQEIAALTKELEQSAQITGKIVEDYAALRQEFEAFKAKVESTPINAAAAHTGATTVADSEY